MSHRNDEPTPRRLVEQPTRTALGELLQRLPVPEPTTEDRTRSWRRVQARLRTSPRRAWLPAGALVTLVVLVAALWVSRREPVRHIATGPEGTAALRRGGFDVRFGEQTSAELSSSPAGALQIALRRGAVTVRRVEETTASRARVLTPSATVEGVSFEVRVASDGTALVSALTDSVEVTRGARTTRLSAGQQWSSAPRGVAPTSALPPVPAQPTEQPAPPPEKQARPERSRSPGPNPPPHVAAVTPATAPQATPAPTPVPAPVPIPGGAVPDDAARWENANRLIRSGQFREAITLLDALAAGEGPYAELALYEAGRVRARELGDPAGAQQSFAAYRQRFPGGALRQEVELGALEAFIGARDLQRALAAADGFLASFPGSERADDVRLLRANLLRDRGDLSAARAAYAELSGQRSRAGAEALYLGAFCARQQGDEAAARAALEGYLARFPHGPHREDALRALGRSE